MGWKSLEFDFWEGKGGVEGGRERTNIFLGLDFDGVGGKRELERREWSRELEGIICVDLNYSFVVVEINVHERGLNAFGGGLRKGKNMEIEREKRKQTGTGVSEASVDFNPFEQKKEGRKKKAFRKKKKKKNKTQKKKEPESFLQAVLGGKTGATVLPRFETVP